MYLDIDNLSTDQSNALVNIIQTQITANNQMLSTNQVHSSLIDGTNTVYAMYFHTMNSDYSPAVILITLAALFVAGWVLNGFFSMLKHIFS